MARTVLAITSVVDTGVAFTGAAPDATNGNAMPNNGRQFLLYKNGDASSHTVTINAYPKGDTPNGLTVSDLVVTVAAGATKLIGPFPPSIFNNSSNQVEIDFSSATSQLQTAYEFVSDPG